MVNVSFMNQTLEHALSIRCVALFSYRISGQPGETYVLYVILIGKKCRAKKEPREAGLLNLVSLSTRVKIIAFSEN